MTLAALIDAGASFDRVASVIGSLGLPVKIEIETTKRAGIAAKRLIVAAESDSKHRHLHHIEKIIDSGSMTDGARALAKTMFRKLAEAEAEVHQTTMEKVHFHEVGALDSIVDFVGVAVAFDELKPDVVSCRPVPTGSGYVDCDHGRMPVPAPATARLLVGVPTLPGDVASELTTPTGAAIVKTTVTSFVANPSMTVRSIGHGAGTKDFGKIPNVLRVLIGESTEPHDGVRSSWAESADRMWLLETNVDDAPAEIIAYAIERIFAAGAVDVWTQPIFMKKGRQGTLLAVLSDEKRREGIERTMLAEIGVFGVRRRSVDRIKLARRHEFASIGDHQVRVKIGVHDGVRVVSPEFEDCADLARRTGRPLREIYDQAVAFILNREPST
jgi:hypothetical protein